jgi:hypothetical protein
LLLWLQRGLRRSHQQPPFPLGLLLLGTLLLMRRCLLLVLLLLLQRRCVLLRGLLLTRRRTLA